MNLIQTIDDEIARLQKVRALLSNAPERGNGFKMSPATRKKMAAAQKKRWASLKKKS